MRISLRAALFFSLLFFIALGVSASSSLGVIDPNGSGNYKAEILNDPGYASPTINFGKFTTQSASNITVSSSELRGFAWGELTGWIVMNCADTSSGCSGTNGNFKVANNGSGLLSGYAWGENTGWVNFGPFTSGAAQVKITSSGLFGGSVGTAGYAWSENFGWIIFDCGNANTCVETDWRQGGGNSSGSGGGGGGDGNPPPTPPPTPPPSPPVIPPETPLPPPDTVPPAPPIEPEPPIPGGDSGPGAPGGGGGGGSPPNREGFRLPTLPKDIPGIVTKQFERATKVVVETLAIVATVLDTPVGQATVAVTASAGMLAFFLQTLFSNGWRFFLSLFGFYRKRRNWGTVYDSVTKQPLDPAYVVVYDKFGREVVTQITDLDGRFGFLLPPGEYTVKANKTHYAFPSTVLAGKTSDGIYNDLYFGEPITIANKEQVVIKNIPMDAQAFDWNEAEKRRRNLFYFTRSNAFSKISIIVFSIGFAISFLALVLAPSVGHLVVFGVYVLIYLIKTFFIPPVTSSFVLEKSTRKPVPFALVRIYGANSRSELMKKVTSLTGGFYCLIANGTYFLTVERRNPDGTYTLAHTSSVFTVKKGVIAAEIEI
ncbi:MAG TPA: carboxypeptidase regulatory-like domain-containing protein [Candidatus Paceibacterota bacterium]|nr:carboxypeptidase regulatory-like domain-containing protein [Candidatus Paceibacterota bacterium]